MASPTAPQTPINKAPLIITRQLASPPTTGRPSKVVVLPADARYASVHTRRKRDRLTQMVKHPFAPLEAALVAIHPFYRGKKHDGHYYQWLLDLCDGDMPDIVRRINKFRGFPQNDDPTWNTVNADEWRLKYSTDEYQADLQRYLPYLEAYWNECGKNFEDHVGILNTYHQYTDKHSGLTWVLSGNYDAYSTGNFAERVNTLYTPPSMSSKELWGLEMEDYDRDIRRSFADERFRDFWEEGEEDEEVQDVLFQYPTSDTLSGHSHTDTTPRNSSAVTSVLLASEHRLRDMPQSPGLLWTSQRTRLRTPYTNPKRPLTSGLTGSNFPHSPRTTRSLPSIFQYHSPAGDILSPEFPKTSDWTELNIRADHQALAVANGFVPTPRNGIQGRISADDKSLSSQNHLSLPMGALRYDPKYRSPFNQDSLAYARSSQKPVDFPPITPNKRPKTAHPTVSIVGKGRKRTASSAAATPRITPAKRGSGRRNGRNRRNGRKGKRRGNKGRNNDSDSDFVPDSIRDDHKEKKWEVLPSKFRDPSVHSGRQHKKAKTVAATTQPRITAGDCQAIKQERVGEDGMEEDDQVMNHLESPKRSVKEEDDQENDATESSESSKPLTKVEQTAEHDTKDAEDDNCSFDVAAKTSHQLMS